MRSAKRSELTRAAVDGDRLALERLLSQVGPVILATARQILRDPHDAEDVAQEAMISFVRDLRQLRDPAAVTGFARRLTARLAIRARQRKRAEAGRRRDTEGTPLPASVGSPEHDTANREHAELLLTCLEGIPAKQAEAFLLRCVHDYSLAEIAALLEVPENTAKSRIRLAKLAIGKWLERHPKLAAPRQEGQS